MTEYTAAALSEQLHLVGAGGHASVVADIARSIGYSSITIWARESPEPERFPSATVFRPIDLLHESTPIVLAFGDLNGRAALRARFEVHGPALVHPSAICGHGVNFGAGTVVMAGCILNANASVGPDVILNTGCVVEHDCVVGANVHVSPGACLAGGARVDTRAHVGAGAIILPGIVVGSGAVVGAGAVVTRDVLPGERVVGVPARPLPAAP